MGFRLPFNELGKPRQNKEPPQHTWSDLEAAQIQECVDKLLRCDAINEVQECADQFISRIFIVPKSDGSSRFILNLKELNTYILNEHFKMEDHRTVIKTLLKQDFLAKIDLKDAYYLVPVAKIDRKYLRFQFNSKLYEYNCLPFGLACAPRIFTKIIRQVVNKLRSTGNRSVVYLDDFLLLGKTQSLCESNINDTLSLLSRLGLLVNKDKSILRPAQELEFLGFVFNSTQLTISLPSKKIVNLINMIQTIRKLNAPTIAQLASLTGSLIAATPAVPYSMLRTRNLEILKQAYLLENNNDFEGKCQLSQLVLSELDWWQARLPKSGCKIRCDKFDYSFDTDASTTGWGATFQGRSTRGFWSNNEQLLHINTLELKAVYNGLNSFFRLETNCQIIIRVDSTTAICYINKQGGCRSVVNHEWAQKIWDWCEERSIFILATYINTKANVDADAASRQSIDENDFGLDDHCYQRIVKELGNPQIDLFATHHTSKCKRFISWYPDPLSEDVDAFTVKWSDLFYAFPPFALIGRVLKKIIDENATGIVVAPVWKCQAWYPLYKSLIVGKIIVFKKGSFYLKNPYNYRPHPLYQSMSLMAALLTGKK